MADKVDMSLDDIIKSNKKTASQQKQSGKQNSGKGGAFSQSRSRSRSRGRGPPLKALNNGGVGKAKSRSRSRPKSGGSQGSKRGGIRRVASTGSIRRSRSRSGVRSQQSGGGRGPGKLIISNLDPGVSDTDIQELFAEFGELQSAALHYDRTGQSLGTADVVFQRRSDCIKAMKQYDGVPLDGRPMKIEIATSQSNLTDSVLQRTGAKPKARSASVSRRRSRSLGGVRAGKVVKKGVVRGYKGARQGVVKKNSLREVKKEKKFKKAGGGKKKILPVSRETLDKEIDSFMLSR